MFQPRLKTYIIPFINRLHLVYKIFIDFCPRVWYNIGVRGREAERQGDQYERNPRRTRLTVSPKPPIGKGVNRLNPLFAAQGK